jgi:predicted dinucleotide-binding enzyme
VTAAFHYRSAPSLANPDEDLSKKNVLARGDDAGARARVL